MIVDLQARHDLFSIYIHVAQPSFLIVHRARELHELYSSSACFTTVTSLWQLSAIFSCPRRWTFSAVRLWCWCNWWYCDVVVTSSCRRGGASPTRGIVELSKSGIPSSTHALAWGAVLSGVPSIPSIDGVDWWTPTLFISAVLWWPTPPPHDGVRMYRVISDVMTGST